MTLADYLASEAAREDVRLAMFVSVATRCIGEQTISVRMYPPEDGEAFHCVMLTAGGRKLRAYYRPDGERYTVTDLGEGVKAKRLRTGDLTQPAFEPRTCWQYGDLLGADKITAADLPDAICRVMLASLRVAQS